MNFFGVWFFYNLLYSLLPEFLFLAILEIKYDQSIWLVCKIVTMLLQNKGFYQTT